ncbi:FIG004453: protein YceG like [hydrothermal vent metagenome]|uniref:FIG004453: protein YceG like n=1 Tax=hydrothermal vent metagenome TaxID=652676 RepID=A0A3B1E5L9_9ZZZZ
MTMTKGDFLYKLTTSKAPLKSVTLIPGETYYFFLNNVAQKLKISKTKLFYFYEKYAFKKDGNILAQTYSLPIGMDEEEFIIYLFNYTNTQYKKYSNKIFGLYNRQNWFKYITIASIIQKESASKDEMKFISSVIHNRIKKNMKLQMDGTLNYGQFSHTKITPQMIREDNSNYNTYKIRNIPNHPICAVEINSIKAAIFPKQTKYLYFMKSSNSNKHIFSKTYNKHKKAITKVMKQKRKKRDIKNLWKFK